MDTCSITLGQINFSIRHNLQFNNHKKLDKIRNTMQKTGIKLVHFPILYDFWKWMKDLKIKMEPNMEIGGKVNKWHCNLKSVSSRIRTWRIFELQARTNQNDIVLT